MNTRVLAGLALCVLLAACGSTPPTDFYLLSADAPRAGGGAGPSVGIAELGVAEYLRRPEIVTMESANRVNLKGFERWAEPLEDGVRRTLELNLGALLDTDRVRSRPWSRDWKPDWLVRCSILRIDARPEAVELVAAWSVQRAGGALTERTSRLSRSRSGTSVDSLVSDISALLLELGERIVAGMRETPEAVAGG